MVTYSTRVFERNGGWRLEVKTVEGLCLEYRYESRAQARFVAVIFQMGPASFPKPARTWFQPPRRNRKATVRSRPGAAQGVGAARGPDFAPDVEVVPCDGLPQGQIVGEAADLLRDEDLLHTLDVVQGVELVTGLA